MRPRTVLGALSLLAMGVVALGAQAVPASSAAYLASIANSTDTVATSPYLTCASATNASAERAGAVFVFPLNETATTYLLGATDQSGHANGTYRGAFATSTTTPLACPRDTGGAYVLDGSSSYVSSPTQFVNPTTFSLEVWFKTSQPVGKLIGFGDGSPLLPSTSTQYDRHVYFSPSGQLNFGIYNNGFYLITSPLAYNDNAWHHLVATLSPSTGMRMYVDGALVASNATYTTPENTTGYWRVGYDSLNYWSNTPSSNYFNGQMRWAAVYSILLTPAQVTTHYLAGR